MKVSTLVYTSRSTMPVTAPTLAAMAEFASEKNALVGITGLLLYGSGHFMQVLEGNNSSVYLLYERIKRDRRHASCQMLYEQKQADRLFPRWNMGQLNLDNADMDGKSDWEVISSTLARAGGVNWQSDNTVVAWVREFMEHNGGLNSMVA